MSEDTSFRWTVPNVLSLYRLLSFPLVLYMVLSHNEQVFAVLLVINLITDILDGLIARVFNQRTAIGAKLDSAADLGTLILAVSGLIQFKEVVVEDHMASILAFLLLYLTGYAIAFVRFRKLAGLHLYSFKLTAYLQGIFFFVLFVFGYVEWLYYLAILPGILAASEEIVILLLLRSPQSDVKGLYWVMRDQSRT